jgi:hypothetical protein
LAANKYVGLFGDQPTIKDGKTLRLGFQNVGGVPTKAGQPKDDFLRAGINKYDFDIMGIAESNVKWDFIPEADRLYNMTKNWWESSHLITSHNKTSSDRNKKQYGGVAMWSLGQAAHRIPAKGQDPGGLGHWAWVQYRGKSDCSLLVITAYRPAAPQGGPFTVYAQQRTALLACNDTRCPRAAFLEDLCKEITDATQKGNNIILMLDRNEDQLQGQLFSTLSALQLREAISGKHGHQATVCSNLSNAPIDGIWCSNQLQIKASGYLPFHDLLPNTNHRVLYIDMTYEMAFGTNLPRILRPTMRRLKCGEPRCVENFIASYYSMTYSVRPRISNSNPPTLLQMLNKKTLKNLMTSAARP